MTWLLLWSLSAQAEYRAFLLKIVSADGASVRYEKSFLDPLQYPSYYHVNPGEKITYVDTWMCRERTNDQPFCESPHAVNPEQQNPAPSGENIPTRAPASTDTKTSSK